MEEDVPSAGPSPSSTSESVPAQSFRSLPNSSLPEPDPIALYVTFRSGATSVNAAIADWYAASGKLAPEPAISPESDEYSPPDVSPFLSLLLLSLLLQAAAIIATARPTISTRHTLERHRVIEREPPLRGHSALRHRSKCTLRKAGEHTLALR